MDKEKLVEKRSLLADQYRTITETAKAEKRSLTEDETGKLDSLKSEIEQTNLEIRAWERDEEMKSYIKNVPANDSQNETELRSLFEAMKEKRALTVNGTGAVNVVNEIVKAMSNKTSLLQRYRYFRGANASTIIPILNPSLAVPAGQSEGADDIAADDTAVLSAKTVQPKAYVSVLPVSAEALLMSGAPIESELPSIFGDAFAQAMLIGSLTGNGSGNNMHGIFHSTAITPTLDCAAAGAPKLFDVAKLALEVQDYLDDAVIVMNPTLVAGLIAESTTESAPIKAELMSSRTIMGVPVVMTGRAPSATTAGAIVAVAVSGSNYGVGIANELVIDPIKVKGDTNTYFQATMFFNGRVINPANGIQLVAVSGT